MGMVLTLIIVCDESEYEAALKASMEAGREHPSRILLVVSGQGRTALLDAEVRIGEGTPGEVVIIRMRGAIAAHPASVIRPLLLPDSPVVIWWPGKWPTNLAADELAHLARRRLTDASTATRPLAGLRARGRELHAGRYRPELDPADPWRALLAAAPDQYPRRSRRCWWRRSATIRPQTCLPRGCRARLNLEVPGMSHGPESPPSALVPQPVTSRSPGPTGCSRPTQCRASPSARRPEGREVTELISEELRRMHPDDVFESIVKTFVHPPAASKRTAKKPAAKKSAARKSAAKKPAAKQGQKECGGPDPWLTSAVMRSSFMPGRMMWPKLLAARAVGLAGRDSA